jgi:hypothetical protein
MDLKCAVAPCCGGRGRRPHRITHVPRTDGSVCPSGIEAFLRERLSPYRNDGRFPVVMGDDAPPAAWLLNLVATYWITWTIRRAGKRRVTRIISARLVDKKERHRYEKEIGGQ